MPFDLSEGSASPVLDELVAGPAAALTAVAVVVGARARASGWGADVAVALARRWRGTRRVLLIDLDLEQPSLHERLGTGNEEGAIDIVEYGVSPRRVLRPVDDGAFDLIPAGAFTADAGAVLRHDAWTRLLVEAAANRATVLAYLPADADGAAAMIERAGAVLVVADADEADAVVARLDHPYAVLAVLTPPAPAAPEPVSQAPVHRLTDEEFERIRLPKDRAGREALIADLRERQRSARMDAPVATSAEHATAPDPASSGEESSHAHAHSHSHSGEAVLHVPDSGGDVAREMRVEAAADDVRLDELDTIQPAEAGRTRVRAPRAAPLYTHPIAWTVFIVLFASMLGGAWRFLANRDDTARSAATATALADSAAAATADSVAAAEAAAAAAVAAGDAPLPVAVAVEAHRDAVTAIDRVAALLDAEPGTRFHVAPLERDGVMFYHVMAGPLPDSAAALALRDTLIARGHKTAPTPTDIRLSPLAYAVGEHDTPAAANEQLDVLRRLGVPGYMITTGAAGQPPRYRIYVGGFATRAEADVVGQLLRAAGVRDSLVTRTGSITS